MALEPPKDTMSEEMKKTFRTIEWAYLILYTIEAFLKISALGFVQEKHSYLKDWWNFIDFSIVVLSWVTVWFDLSSISAFRALRALRTLRTLTAFPRMAKLVNNLITIIPPLMNIIFLCLVSVIVFACISMQLFTGLLHNRCVDQQTISNTTDYTNETWLKINGEYDICKTNEASKNSLVKHDEDTCLQGYICLERDNPNGGLISFDNVLITSLLTFEMFTLDGWSTVMYLIRKSQKTYAYDIFFLFVVYVGAFFILNLITAVIYNYYDMLKKKAAEQAIIKEKAKFSKLSRTINATK